MTLEQYFVGAFLRNGAIDHSLRASINTTGKKAVVSFYIHPNGKDGDTLDYEVSGDSLIAINSKL